MSNKLPPDPADGFDPVPLSQPTAHGQAKRHSEFYFDNTLIVIQVEDTLFNVHKYQLLKSEAFAHMFKAQEALPSDPASKEGSGPDNPIVLGVKASDFEALLTLLYATHFESSRPSPESPLIVPAFRLANAWGFSDLRAHLLPLAYNALGDADKIAFAREFDIREWLLPAHVRLCQRQEPLTREEASKIGMDSLLMIFLVREEFPPKQGPTQVPSCSGLYRSGYGNQHCTGCIQRHNANHPTPTHTIEARVKQWVDNGCALPR